MEGSGHGGVGRRGEEAEEEEEERPAVVYCAVGKDGGREWKANLRWVLASFPHRSRRRLSLVLAHVHRPPHRINMMGAWVPVSQLAEHEVAAYRKLEENKASRALDDLLHICSSQRVQARKVIVSADDAARGLVWLVDDHAVAELVMGAAADRAYTRKMCAPRSKKAVTVQRKANPSCRIWFLCKGNLICTREADEGGLNRAEPSTGSSSPSPRSSAVSDCSRSKPSTPSGMHESAGPTTLRTSSRDADSDNATDHNSAEDDHQSHDASSSSSAAAAADVAGTFFSAAPASTGLRDAEDQDSPAPSHHGSSDGAGEMDDDALYERLKDALVEARNLRHEAYEETRRRQKADRDLAHASRMAKEAESSWQGEARRRKETVEKLARERAAMEQDRRDLDGILDKIREVDGRSAELELQVADSERLMGQLDVRLSESYGVLDALRRERRREREEEPASSSEPCMAAAEEGGDRGVMSFWRVRLSELEDATGNFDESARIGGGVYRGSLRGMSVAVRMVSPEVAVDKARFTREAEAMSRARHPGLVAFVGACPEARAVVHELLPGGSLEDRLEEGNAKAPPLPWQARCGVAYRTCSALGYIHSTGAAHGDVHPANILLEDDDERCSSSKLAGFGMRGLVGARTPRGPALAYVDPRYLATGEPTPRSDVHALGVVLLRLVTGKRAFAARKAARDAAAGNTPWHEAVDTSAGGWPMERATEVALLGLKCCGDDGAGGGAAAEKLLEEVRGVLEAATMAAPGRTWSSLSSASGTGSEGGGGAPSYFLCPILKEVMRDPQIAGDGFTYEAEAMREWLGSGHDTSPMTNLKLATDELVPNHALRAAIQEWRHTTTPGTSSASPDRFH